MEINLPTHSLVSTSTLEWGGNTNMPNVTLSRALLEALRTKNKNISIFTLLTPPWTSPSIQLNNMKLKDPNVLFN
jgi:hypothetical protein